MTATPTAPNGVANGHRAKAPMFDVATADTTDPGLLAMQEQIDRAREEGAAGPEGPFKSPVTDALRQQKPSIKDLATVSEPPSPHWADELRAWWINTADRDISESLDKVVAYGGSGPAYDLVATGHDLAALNGRKVSEEEAVEMGIAFYLSSKVNRWMAAVIDGRRPSDDTLFDITYYSMMARRNRAVGGWPVA